MRGRGWLIAALFTGAVLSWLASGDTGYAILVWPPYEVRLSALGMGLLFVASVCLTYALLRGSLFLITLPDHARRWRRQQRQGAARQATQNALTALLEGRYQKAERAARHAATLEQNEQALQANLLLAARAAHAVRDWQGRDRYLADCLERFGDSLALAMTEAELLEEQHRLDEALQAIGRARSFSPKLTAALRLELRLRQQLNQPEISLQLIDDLQKSEAISSHQAQQIRLSARLQQLKQNAYGGRELKEWWRKIDTAGRGQRRLIEAVARRLAELGEGVAAAELIGAALANDWQPELAELYGRLFALGGQDLDPIQQLHQAENWLRQQPNDHQLLLTLGRLCRQQQLWGKAQSYFEASLALHATAASRAELAGLLEQLGHNEAATQHYRQALQQALGNSPA